MNAEHYSENPKEIDHPKYTDVSGRIILKLML
jgi:hypothetical protein